RRAAPQPCGLDGGRKLVHRRRRQGAFHALPAGAAQCRRRRRPDRWSAQRRAARSLQPDAGPDGRAASPALLKGTTKMIMQSSDKSQAIRALRNAAPYIRLFKGKTFVIKAGGAVFGDADATSALIEQIAILHTLGIRVVMVHGGGPQLTQVTEAMGVPTKMVQGRRVTDEKSLDATSMVLNGLINTKLLTICREHEIDAVGVSGVDAGLITAHKRGPVKVEGEMVDYGFVGDIDLVDESVLKKLLDSGLMPVVSPLSADDKGQLLNINADTVAAAIGAALDAEKLILCTGAPGILENVADPGSVISYTD